MRSGAVIRDEEYKESKDSVALRMNKFKYWYMVVSYLILHRHG